MSKASIALLVACAAVVLADLTYHKHGHYSWEEIVGFQAAFAFVGCGLIVGGAALLRWLAMRDEDYWDR